MHDLSCFGRCALTVIMPTLSVLGVQTVPVPTALLSTHTGGFTDTYTLDLKDAIAEIGKRLDNVGVDFDAIYTGYLGSAEQVRVIEDFIGRFRGSGVLVLVDPVMGDGGARYSGCGAELVREMKRLVAAADVITPNLTEACLLTDTPYVDLASAPLADSERFARELAASLGKLTGARCLITGIPSSQGVSTYVSGTLFTQPLRCREYQGTGDLFASVLLGTLLYCCERADDALLARAAEFASKTVASTIDYSVQNGSGEPLRDGVLLEGRLLDIALEMRERFLDAKH